MRKKTKKQAAAPAVTVKRVISQKCAFVRTNGIRCGRKATKTKAVWSATIAFMYHVKVCNEHFFEP